MTIYIHVFSDVHEIVETYININLYNTEIFLYKPWRPKFFFNMESSFIYVLGYLNADHVIGLGRL